MTDGLSRTESAGVASTSIRAASARGEIGSFRPSMRNPLDKPSVAQILDGHRLMGSLHFPEAFFSEGAVRAQ
jgi:hypothetical protein